LLREAGFPVSETDPGPGCVIGFDESFRPALLCQGASAARDYAAAIEKHIGGESPSPSHAPPAEVRTEQAEPVVEDQALRGESDPRQRPIAGVRRSSIFLAYLASG